MNLRGQSRYLDKDVFSVKSDTRKVLVFLVNKLLEKSPIIYGLVRNLEWLNPIALCTNQPKCVQQLTRALQILIDMHHVAAGQCDLFIRQYKEFATENAANENFMSFKVGTDRLDVLFMVLWGKTRSELNYGTYQKSYFFLMARLLWRGDFQLTRK